MLESRVEILERDVAIIKQSNKLLERKADDNEQYSRRMCLRINGIPIQEGVKENDDICFKKVKYVLKDLPGGNTVNDWEIDRAHRVGKTNKGCQQMIVKFSSWRARALVYKNKKSLLDLKIYLDLTTRRFTLLKLAVTRVKDNSKVHFAFSDGNCSLCLRLSGGRYNECEKDQILLFIVSTNPYIGSVFDLVLSSSSSKILSWTISGTSSIFIFSIAVTSVAHILCLVLLMYKKCSTLVASCVTISLILLPRCVVVINAMNTNHFFGHVLSMQFKEQP